MRLLIALMLCWLNVSFAQIVSVPIPGAPGLSVTVGVGANALPLRDIRTNPAAVNITTWDDSWSNVPLGFNFPFFGRNFTDSWAMTNGVVTFQDPAVSGAYGLCCEGVNLTTTTDPRYNWSIYPLHSDLYSWNGQNQWYLRENNSMTYGWYNISQCCSSNGGNSFELKIDSTGLVDTRIAGAFLQWNRVTSGMAGDLSQGQYYQYYHGQGINVSPTAGNIFSWQALSGTGAADMCIINPLSSPACPGYQTAYLTQQCTISALYDPTCPGYQQAYFTYQCSINPLYSELCPGYQQAYFDQQCSINPLYNSSCPGYAQAYFNQQCSLNGLYDRTCPNYAEAYATQQLLNNQQAATTTTVVSTVVDTTTTQTPAAVSLVADTNVNAVLTNNSTAAAPSVSPASVTTAVPLVQQQQPAQSSSPASPVATATTQQTNTPPPPPAQQSPQPTTRAQQIQQARAEAAKKEAATKSGENMKEAKEAKSMEQQVAVQGSIVAAMGYNPGFDVYTTLILKDTPFYKPFEIYKGKENVDNTRVLRGLYGPSENRHQQLINQQYK